MNLSLPEDVLDQMALEQAHFDAAPQAFFEAWKRGAQIAGHEWFGDGTREGLQRDTTKWDLRPNMLMLNDALGVLSSGQRMFLSAMVSFYNSREGGAMQALRLRGAVRLRRPRSGTAPGHRRPHAALQRLVSRAWQPTVFSSHPTRDMRPRSGPCPSFFSQERPCPESASSTDLHRPPPGRPDAAAG